MMNMSIECEAKSCVHHHESENYCTLNYIHVTEETEIGQKTKEADCANYKIKPV